MNTKKLKPVPKFRTSIEEALFWDNHDLTDYFDFSKPSKIRFELGEKEKEETLTLRLQTKLKERLEKMADSLGISTSSLLRMWAIEKLSPV